MWTKSRSVAPIQGLMIQNGGIGRMDNPRMVQNSGRSMRSEIRAIVLVDKRIEKSYCPFAHFQNRFAVCFKAVKEGDVVPLFPTSIAEDVESSEGA